MCCSVCVVCCVLFVVCYLLFNVLGLMVEGVCLLLLVQVSCLVFVLLVV